MRRMVPLALLALNVRCITAPALRAPPAPLRLVAVETPTGDLDALGRMVSLTVRFDRALAWPVTGAAMLVTGAATDSLRSDAGDGALSPTNAPRLVPVRLSLDPHDPTALRLDATEPLLPDAPAALLVTPLVRAADGASIEAPDGGPRTLAVSLRVAPARRCGALARVEPVEPGDAPASTARIHVRFDRAVRGVRGEGPFALATDAGRAVPSRSSLDCFEPDGAARCGWVEPAVALAPLTSHRVLFGALTARDGARVEVAADAFVTGPRREALRVAFGPAPVCAAEETPMGSFCVRTTDRWIELRASTTRPALVRVTATAMAPGAPEHVAIGASGTAHTVRVYVTQPATAYALTAQCLGADGRPHDSAAIALVATAQRLPRVRITEVLAHPHGASGQEYVELVNDDRSAANLSGYVIAQGASRSALPDGSILAPGARALVVGASFDPRGAPSQGDPPAAPGATLFALRSALAGRGLRDSGGDVTLADPDGRVLSFVPGSAPSRAPREGVGLVRAETDLDDEDPAAWSYDALDGCTPGAPDRLR